MVAANRIALAAIIVAAPFAVGGTRADVQLCLAVLVALVALWSSVSSDNRAAQTTWLTYVWFAPSLWATLQLVPLPIGLLSNLSPRSAALYLTANPAVGWAPISVDTTQTQICILHGLTFGIVVLLTEQMRREEIRLLRRAIIASVCVSAVVALIHHAFDAQQIYGLYTAIDRASLTGFFGPFVNENTFAAFCILGSLLAGGEALSSEEVTERTLCILAAIGCALACVSTGSRGGAIALAMGWIIFMSVALYSHRTTGEASGSQRTVLLLTGGVLIGLVALMLIAPADLLASSDLMNDQKVRIWISALPLVSDYWMTGSGRGTFGLVFSQVQSFPIDGSVSHAENIGLRTLIETGIFFSLLMLGVLGFLCRKGCKRMTRHQRPSHWAIGSLLIAIGVQQFADFGLESMGLSLPVAVCLGAFFGSRRLEIDESDTIKRLTIFSATGLLVFALLCSVNVYASVADGHLRPIKEAALDQMEEATNEIFADHPADYMVPRVACTRLSQAQKIEWKQILYWCAQAQRLAPLEGDIHLRLARLFTRDGAYGQAVTEYRLALRKQPWESLNIIAEVANSIASPVRLAELTRGDRVNQVRVAETLLSRGMMLRAKSFAQELVLLNEENQAALNIWARVCLQSGNIPCARQRAAELNSLGHGLLAQGILVLAAATEQDIEGFRTHLEAGKSQNGFNDGDFLHRVVKGAMRLGLEPESEAALDQLWKLEGHKIAGAVRSLTLRGNSERLFGRTLKAHAAYEQAFQLAPSISLSMTLSRLELELGRTDIAMKRLQAALTRWPQSTELRRALERIEKARPKNEGTQD